jgi:hypothetical protein
MTPEKTKKLFDDFPQFFKPERPLTESLMGFGFEHGDGWFNLVYQLCQDLTKLDAEFEVLQVKEKFGTLRFYTTGIRGDIDAAYGLIDKAEKESGTICEICGEPGETRGELWLRTTCTTCEKVKK